MDYRPIDRDQPVPVRSQGRKEYKNHESPVAILKKPGNIHGMIAGEEPGYRTFCYIFPADRLRPDPPGEAVPSFFVPG
jgi:hypothetical protein